MTIAESARQALELMLTKLGQKFEIEVHDDPRAPLLQVHSSDAQSLIGKRGERLEDIQHLVNKLVQQKFPGAPRVRIDVEHFRDKKEEGFLKDIRRLGDKVRAGGEAVQLEPMNSYQRRLVHNLFKDDPDVKSWSPEDSSRLKRISLLPRNQPADGAGEPPAGE